MRRVCHVLAVLMLALWLAQSTSGWAHATCHHETRGHCAVCRLITGTPAVPSAPPSVAPLCSRAALVAPDAAQPLERPGRPGCARGPPPRITG